MEKLKVFACSDSAEQFTNEICDYLKIEKQKLMLLLYQFL